MAYQYYVRSIPSYLEICSDKYSAPVEYVQPSFTRLKQAFDWVSNDYSYEKFRPIDVCKDVPTDSCVIEFVLLRAYRSIEWHEVLSALEECKLRPALYEEQLAFAAKHPELQKRFRIAAFGSVCNFDSGDEGDVSVLSWSRVRGRSLRTCFKPFGWPTHYRFLAVRRPV